MIKNRIKQDLQVCRTLSRKERREFIWDYYKLPIIAVSCIAAVVLLSAVFQLGRGDTAMYAVLVNADDTGDSAVFDQLLCDSGAASDGTVDVSASYTLRYDDPANTYGDTVQVLAALFGIGDLDVFIADEAVFRSYDNQGAFIDLSLFLEPALLDRQTRYTHTDESGRQTTTGIVLGPGSPIHEAGFYTGEVILGVAANAQNLDPAIAFVKALAEAYPS